MPRTNEENDTVSYSNSGKATNIEEHLSFTSINTNTATATTANTAITIDIPTETAVNLTTAANVSTPAFVVDIASDSNDEGTNSSSKGRRKMPPVAEVFQLGIRQQQDVIRQKPPKQLRRSTEADIQRRRILDAMRTSTPITNNSQRTHASSSSVASRIASRQRQGATTTTNTSIANTTPALSSFSLSSLSSASASTSTSLLSAASGSHRPLSSLSMPRTVSQPVRRPHGRSPLAPPLSAQITPGMMTSYINAARGYPLSFPIHGAQHGTQDTSGYFGLLSSKTSPSLCKNESNRSKRQQSHRRQQAMEQNQEDPQY
ncbi:hypothetical protein BDF22DRAFT_511030 [Syncephalis plumigaleata]|nr:hypothetical protein BDF22DRAFT_511030 [Syncephalis plumigaleata]